jgi:hypothetical protein
MRWTVAASLEMGSAISKGIPNAFKYRNIFEKGVLTPPSASLIHRFAVALLTPHI